MELFYCPSLLWRAATARRSDAPRRRVQRATEHACCRRLMLSCQAADLRCWTCKTWFEWNLWMKSAICLRMRYPRGERASAATVRWSDSRASAWCANDCRQQAEASNYQNTVKYVKIWSYTNMFVYDTNTSVSYTNTLVSDTNMLVYDTNMFVSYTNMFVYCTYQVHICKYFLQDT